MTSVRTQTLSEESKTNMQTAETMMEEDTQRRVLRIVGHLNKDV